MKRSNVLARQALLHPLALEVRHLRLVLALASTGSLSRASELLHTTQSALSQQLRTLEVRLGIQAYIRSSAGLVPTSAGKSLTALACRVLGDLVDAERAFSTDVRGCLRIAGETYTHYDWLPRVLQRFEKLFPDVAVEVCLSSYDAPLMHLKEGGIDLAFVHSGGITNDMEAWPLFRDELVLVGMSSLLPRAENGCAMADDLSGQRLILHRRTDRDLLLPGCAGQEIPVAVAVIQPTAAVIAAVRAGLGIALIPDWIGREVATAPGMSWWRWGPGGLQQRWLGVVRRSAPQPSYVKAFVRCMRFPNTSG